MNCILPIREASKTVLEQKNLIAKQILSGFEAPEVVFIDGSWWLMVHMNGLDKGINNGLSLFIVGPSEKLSDQF